MNSEFMRGVEISVVSLVVLFAAMAVIVLVISLLERFTRENDGASEAGPETIESDAETGVTEAVSRMTGDEDEGMVAAIAIALTHLRSQRMSQSGLGKALESAPGAWWMMGQMKQTPAAIAVNREED